ncbi:serpin (serine protease inhibitor) domain-containing protein [Ditylenchus destructor]|uniref:Serpin (Serine protease inhibitor) domain-containing protein n=1 Tax=Ditylenchus destructor TaxID=166010 RepID=A0AAD4MQA4_9BILA|nr:serpin (serine protease inhibitor) domain-containing protein [Ditylenchus destructor]
MVEANNDFAATLMKKLTGIKYICISPISISFALALSLAGAKGITEAEIVKLLGKGCSLDEIEAFFVEIKTVFQQLTKLEILHDANRVYYDTTIEILETYKKKVTRLYGVDGYDMLDFRDSDGTAKKINSFVEEITKGNLKDVITANQVRGCKMILLNAIDFRGKWERQFYSGSNIIKEFHLLDGTAKKTEMMTHDIKYMTRKCIPASNYFYCENDEMQRICMRYKNFRLMEDGKSDNEKNVAEKTDVGEISMYIFLPRACKGLPKLLENLNGEKLLKWLRMKPLEDYRRIFPTICDIEIPKFTTRSDIKLNETLEKLGLGHYFKQSADFSGVSNVSLYADSFIHKTYIKADELGTEASAVSYVTFKACGYYQRIPVKVIRKEFHADHPFLYAIVSRKQHVLFIGTVTDVEEKSETEEQFLDKPPVYSALSTYSPTISLSSS